MNYPPFGVLLRLILVSSTMLVLGLYLLANFGRLFRRYIKREWLRRNLVVWLIAICLGLAIAPTKNDFYREATANGNWLMPFVKQCAYITLMALFVFNITYLVSETKAVKRMSFRKRMAVVLASIVFCTMLVGVPVNYWGNGGFFKNLDLTLLFNFYTGCMTGFIFITMNSINLERRQKLNEKELEVSRLQQLKAVAELEALHSKVNPHFLYNALNSIADLALTDGKRARKMTIALADLFRYSINNSQHNFTTVQEEVAMTEVYLQIEKIRFEDQLNYRVRVDEGAGSFLIPRFLLQPVAENAVKHGLKVTGRMTEIVLEATLGDQGLVISVADDGPPFPDELVPGYGVKSVFDKMDLLFPGSYEIFFHNQPRKEVCIHIHKLIKNEPSVQNNHH